MLYDPTRTSAERRLLMLAAEKMEERGLGRGFLMDDKGHPCVLGAIKLALEENREPVEYHAVVVLLKAAVYRKTGKLMYIGDWSDAYCKDTAEAAAMLRDAALNEETK